MGLLRRIKYDYKEARSTRDTSAKVLNTLYTSASSVGRLKGNRETSDEEVMVVINKMIANNKSALSSGGLSSIDRKTAVSDNSILKSYLPQTLTNDELEDIIKGLVSALPVRDIREKDRVIRKLEEYYLGRYNSKYADDLVNGLLKTK